MTAEQFADGAGGNANGDLPYRADLNDQSTAYTYDNMNQLLSRTPLPVLPCAGVILTYAPQDRYATTDATALTRYKFDNSDRLSGVSERAGSISCSHDLASNLTQVSCSANIVNYAYDTLNRLSTLKEGNRNTKINAYDNVGNLQSVASPSGAVHTYGYDAIYELAGLTLGSTTTESYTYDTVDNRLSSLGVSTYNVNTSNELTSTPSTTYTYDFNGNTSTRVDSTGTTQYFWDFENRLSSVTLPGTGGTVSFKYDPLGHRIYKSSSAGTSIYAYDGDNLIEETNATGAVVARYAQNRRIDEPLAMLRSGATSYYNFDGLGSVTSLSSGAGSLAETYSYDSFGKQTSSSGSLTNPFQYTGRELDIETNLYFYRARYYDQNAGRFLSEDPKRFDGGINFYAYVSNSSPNKVDPFGLTPCWNKLTVTGVSNCSVQFVSAKGFSCKLGDPKGQVESLCDQLQKAIQKDGSADLPGTPCPSGQCCKNMQPQKQVQLVNEEFTVTKKGCTATFKLTGSFTVQGDVGTCSK